MCLQTTIFLISSGFANVEFSEEIITLLSLYTHTTKFPFAFLEWLIKLLIGIVRKIDLWVSEVPLHRKPYKDTLDEKFK